MAKVFTTSGAAVAAHVLGALSCGTCWAIAAPLLASILGSSAYRVLALTQPFTPALMLFSAASLAYSFYKITIVREASVTRSARTFTTIAGIAWLGSFAYYLATIIHEWR